MASSNGPHQPRRRGHLNLAADFTADAWFSFDNAAIGEVLHLTASPDTRSITEVLKGDFALFTFTALQLAHKASLSSSARLFDATPLDLIRKATPADLAAIMRQAAANNAHPPLDAMDSAQGARLRSAMVSASAAEILAGAAGVKKESAYTCALFRQLGAALIAWNYPHVHRRALTLARADAPLDDILGKILGFTPALLGLTVAQRWNISPEILRGMGDRTVYPTAKEAAVTSGDRLNEICTLSECVAQSTDPTAYPGAAKRWSDIRATFEQRAGKSALRRLGDALEANCKVYLKVSPTLFQVPPEIAPAAPAIEPTVSRFERNPFTQRCPEHVQSLFRDLYDSLEGTTGERAAATLLQTIAPTLGFKSGCVFIHETESDLLKPRFTAGDRRPIDYPALPAHGSGADPVTVTFLKVSSRAPLKDTGAITGALGEARHHGVLKLVLGPALRGQPAAEVELLFEAFRKTLEDCLEIY